MDDICIKIKIVHKICACVGLLTFLSFHKARFITYRGGLHYGVNMSWIKVKNKK